MRGETKMNERSNEICLSDYSKMAALDLQGIRFSRHEYNGRFYAYYDPSARKTDENNKPVGKTVREILDDYELGKNDLRDFVAAQGRMKDFIFEAERMSNMGSKGGHRR